MLNELLHLFGLCPDSFSHVNLSSLANFPVDDATHFYKIVKSKLCLIQQKISILL